MSARKRITSDDVLAFSIEDRADVIAGNEVVHCWVESGII
jgi:hypothetical protein